VWLRCRNRAPIFSLTTACVVVVSVSTSTMQIAFCTQCNWWNNCLRLIRNSKNGCGGVNSYRSSLSVVGCCGMMVLGIEFLSCTCSVKNQTRFSPKATYNTNHPYVKLLGVIFLITYHLFIIILIILWLGLLVLFSFNNLSPLHYHTNHPLVRLVGIFLITYNLFIVILIILRLDLLVIFF